MTDIAARQVESILSAYRGRDGALLPVLHEIQDALGHVPTSALAAIASALNLSRAEVHGVLSFYHHFRQEPPGRHVVRICRAEACQAVGSEVLAAHAARRLAGTEITLEDTYCLGLCASGPAVQVNESTLHGRMTGEGFDALVAALESKP